MIGSLGNGAPLPTRDIPTAATHMATDEHVQPNHVHVDEDYIAKMGRDGGGPAQDRELVRPPETHDLFLLPATAALAVLVLTLPVTLVFLKRFTPKSFWNTDGTGALSLNVARALLVGGAVYLVDVYC